jgi:predicted HTH transcriptional regulator/predicted transcriptional regulator
MTEVALSPQFADFLEELGAEETIDREFKEAAGGLPRSIWATISAFANTNGGIIVLGVREHDDRLELVGVPHPRRLLDDLHNQSRNSQKISQDMLPPGSVSVREVDNRPVIVIRVRPADRRTRPVFIDGHADGGTYLRRHTGDHVATNDEVNRMMREASDLPADAVILPWIGVDHLDREALSAYRRRVLILDERSPLAELDDVGFLEAIEGYRRDPNTGEEGITVAGLLMFGTEAAIRTWRARHLIDARLLPAGAGGDEPDWADRVLWESHLYGAYNRIYPWLTRDLLVPFRLENGVRDAESERHRALREALVNMLVHADYVERAASLLLRWDGGVLFRNPGRSRVPVPGPHGGNRSDPRNPALLRMFRRIGLSEEAGTGVPRIFRSWRESGFEPPQIDLQSEFDEFGITLPYQHLLSNEDRSWLDDFGAPLTRAEQLALVIARHDEWVDNEAVRNVTGLHGADVSRVLTGLRNRGLLEMVGSKRGASYRLSAATGIADSGQSIADSSPTIADSGSSITDNEPDLADNAENWESLLRIASPARDRKRLPPHQLDRIIVRLCGVEPLSIRQLAALLDRGERHMQEIVRNLVATGAIRPVRRERRHPHQRYSASSDVTTDDAEIQETS